jgi:hypothetical protein
VGSGKGVFYLNGSSGLRIEILVQFRLVDMRASDLPMKVDSKACGFPTGAP